MTETTYDVDLDGLLTRVDEREWRRFALDNGAPEIASPKTVVGRPLAGFLAGPVRDSVTRVLEAARAGRFDGYRYAFRCDAPHRDRELEMRIAPLTDGGRLKGLRFRSIVLRERERLGSVLLGRGADVDGEPPVLEMCSYCKQVNHGNEGWMNPRDYESRGYPTDVALSHGVCPRCNETYLEPMLRGLGS